MAVYEEAPAEIELRAPLRPGLRCTLVETLQRRLVGIEQRTSFVGLYQRLCEGFGQSRLNRPPFQPDTSA